MTQTHLRTLELSFNRDEPEKSASRLVYALLPEWEHLPGQFELKTFTQGITNTMMQARKKQPDLSEEQIEQNSLIVRAFGQGTEKLVDREREILNHLIFAHYGLAPELLARFENGIIYRFTPGQPCQRQDLQQEHIWKGVAKALGKCHALLPTHPRSCSEDDLERQLGSSAASALRGMPDLWTVMRNWGKSIPEDSEERKALKKALLKEVDLSEAQFNGFRGLDGSEFVLSHCDLLAGNIIVLPPLALSSESSTSFKVADVALIDYELGCFAPPAFDIALHFGEWPGYELDYTSIPSQSLRWGFICEYIESYLENISPEKPAELREIADRNVYVNQLVGQVDAMRGLPGLWWALAVQAHNPPDDGVKEFGRRRLDEYWSVHRTSRNVTEKAAERESKWWAE